MLYCAQLNLPFYAFRVELYHVCNKQQEKVFPTADAFSLSYSTIGEAIILLSEELAYVRRIAPSSAGEVAEDVFHGS